MLKEFMSNMINERIEKYKKDGEYSFSFGAFPTFELINKKSEQVVCVLLHSKLNKTAEIEKLIDLCKKKNIEIIESDKTINRIADKENCFVVGVFKKYETKVDVGNNLVLVNPSDMGNMGTIMRTALGFGMKNIIIVRPCVDVFNPKVVRASMGAIFGLNIQEFDSVEEYLNFSKNKKYFFMLDGKKTLGKFDFEKTDCDLVFGNEASGLPDFLLDYDESVVIKHSKDIDSLNLPISVGISLFEFSKRN